MLISTNYVVILLIPF